MEIQFALLADSVNETKEGKLNIMGVFDRIFCRGFPAQHRNMSLVLMITGTFRDVGKHRLQISLVNGDGKRISGEPMPTIPFRMQAPGPGKAPRHRAVVHIQDTPFLEEDDYEIRISVDDRHLGTVPITVGQVGAS